MAEAIRLPPFPLFPVNLVARLERFLHFQPHTRARWDWLSPLACVGLALIGVFFIYSAQLPVHGHNWITQLVWLAMGGAIYLGVSLIDYRFWLSVAHWFYGLALVPLLLVLVPGVGSERFGAQRWLEIGPFTYQPSETAKVAVLVMACASVSGPCATRSACWANWLLRWVCRSSLSCSSLT